MEFKPEWLMDPDSESKFYFLGNISNHVFQIVSFWLVPSTQEIFCHGWRAGHHLHQGMNVISFNQDDHFSFARKQIIQKILRSWRLW